MALGGYAHRLARVNLTGGEVTYPDIPEEWARKYVGGRGLGVRYCLEAGPSVEPLAPENLLCFLNGPLTGTRASMSGRLAVVTRSPLTGTVTDSHQGGWSAARLRWAGLDGILFEGRSPRPVYALVEDGELSLLDASDLWGRDVHETVRTLQDRHGAQELSVIAIGRAGENLVRFAAWLNEHDRASGRGGTGAVGGSKNLKAVVIRAPSRPPAPADREAFAAAHRRTLDGIRDEANVTSPRKGGLSVYGTNVLMNIVNRIGGLPTRNGQTCSFGDRAETISGEHVVETVLVGNPTCHACPVACKKEAEVSSGPFRVRMESVEYESAWAFGATCENDDVEAVAYLIDRCNDLGMDTIEMGNALALQMELTGMEASPEPLAWGDTAGMVQMVQKTALRQGMGSLLAEGPARAAAQLGHPELALHVRGQSIPAYDPRGIKGMGLGYATSNRGACHLRGYSPASELGLISLATDPLAWKGKGHLLKLLQDLHAYSDSLDLCKFSAFAFGAEEYAAQYSAVVGGPPITAEDVLRTGERIYNLERYYNQLAGEPSGSDVLPRRFLEEPSTATGSEGHVCELAEMLEEYYAERGWKDGVVPEEKLQELEIP